jgi:threonine/homoserine/homoserine lactone efflux protein
VVSSGMLLAFAGVVVAAYVVPGPDWVVVLRGAVRGRRSGLLAAAGVQCGLCVHMAAAALGVSTALLHSPVLFTALKYAGAGYLVFLGGQALWQAARRRARGDQERQRTPDPVDAGPGQVFRQAFLSNVLNPKAALFFISVLPQFLTPAGSTATQVLVLGTLDIAIGVLWWGVFVLGATRLSGLMRRRRARAALDRVTGTALVGLGITLAATG